MTALSTFDEIREAVKKLSLEERVTLMFELSGVEFEDDDWDRQMKADAAAGKFDEMNRETDAAAKAGLLIPMEEFCK